MSTLKRTRQAQTVLGLVDPDKLGITLPHEHLICDCSANFNKPTDPHDQIMAYKPFTLDLLWWHRCHNGQNLDDLYLTDERKSIQEALHFKIAGGNTIVDLTNVSMGRDPLGLARISQDTGLNVIMGCGYYHGLSYGAEMNDKTEDEITEEITQDIIEGIGDQKIRSGIIGEIGCSWPLQENERKILRAAARAQRLTGTAINVHPGFGFRESPMEIIGVLSKAGADITRTVISHIDTTLRKSDDRFELAKTGCYLEYDCFGREVGFRFKPISNKLIETINDVQRTYEILELVDKGFVNQVLISQDIANKNNLRSYGGWGYAHILSNVIPCMRLKGLTEEYIHKLLIDNPKRLFTIV